LATILIIILTKTDQIGKFNAV